MKPSLGLIWLLCNVIVCVQQFCQGQDLRQPFLVPHNMARAKVGVGPLQWNDTVAAYAQNYANQRRGDCALRHSGGPYGENLFWGFGRDFTPGDAVRSWVDEKQYYDYASNSCVKGRQCGHYTQVVWRNSVNLGCARVVCDNGAIFIICNYDPPGNFIGERPYLNTYVSKTRYPNAISDTLFSEA